MTTRVPFGLCIASALTGSLAAAAQQLPAPDLAVKISTPIYRANGNVDGGSGTWKLQMNQPIVAYPNGGAGFCGPGDAAGWRVEVTPVSQGNATVLNVNWQHVSLATANGGQQLLSERQALTALEGRASGSARDLNDVLLARRRILDIESQLAVGLKGSPVSTRQLTLQPGDHVVMDYIGTSARPLSLDMAIEVTHVTGRPPCDVVGMGLEINLESTPKAPAIVETDLWLVYSRTDKTEQTQHQTLRVRTGDSAMYWFDNVAVQLPAPPAAASAGSTASRLAYWKSVLAARLTQGMAEDHPDVKEAKRMIRETQDKYDKEQSDGAPKPVQVVEVPIQVSGRIAPVDLGDGKIHMKLTIARSSQVAPHGIGTVRASQIAIEPPASGGATYDVVAEPGEVLSFQLPPMRTQAGTADSALAVRLRTRKLGLSLVALADVQAQVQAAAMSSDHQALLTEALSFPGIASVMKVTAVASGVPSPPAPMQHLSASYRPPGTQPQGLDMSNVVEPKLLSNVEPTYPTTAIADGVQGTSIVEAIIDHEGRVIEARVVDGGVVRLDQATLDAIKQRRYSPLLQGGVARAVLINFKVTYALR